MINGSHRLWSGPFFRLISCWLQFKCTGKVFSACMDGCIPGGWGGGGGGGVAVKTYAMGTRLIIKLSFTGLVKTD